MIHAYATVKAGEPAKKLRILSFLSRALKKEKAVNLIV